MHQGKYKQRSMYQWSTADFLLIIFVISATLAVRPRHGVGHPGTVMNVTAVVGVSIDVRCRVRLRECGNFKRIEWYRQIQRYSANAAERVFVYYHDSGVYKYENVWRGRAGHVYDTRRHEMVVTLMSTSLRDEGSYRCEVAYAKPLKSYRESCQLSQETRLTLYSRPEFLRIEMSNGSVVRDGATVGPFTVGTLLQLRCRAGSGKPMPEIRWWNHTTYIPPVWSEEKEHGNGTGSAVSEIHVFLARESLGRRLSCTASTPALDFPMTSSLTLDMNLAPLALEMKQPRSTHVAEGVEVTVTCIARGAKPPATIYWNSEPEMDLGNVHEEVRRRGYVFDTMNQLTFKAKRKLTSLSCFASNKVLDEGKNTHLTRATTIHVKFRPEIMSEKSDNFIKLVQGQNITLECRYEANPMVGTVVHWYHNGHIINYNHPQFLRVGANDSSGLEKLHIMNADSGLEGQFSCSAENEVGKSKIEPLALVEVEEKPRARLVFEPSSVINELLNANVTLVCLSDQVEERFLAVKWYLDGEVLQHIALAPECGEHFSKKRHIANARCNMDTSKVILVNVTRTFQGNYSCQGKNKAGWGPGMEICKLSPDQPLRVLFPPTGASITYEPSIIVKGKSFQLSCEAKDPGFPPIHTAQWFHNGVRMENAAGLKVNFPKAKAESAGNYSCIPINKVGASVYDPENGNETSDSIDSETAMATTNIEVHSGPTFVTALDKFVGAPLNHSSLALKCVVECDPLCSIAWFRDGKPVRGTTKRPDQYVIKSAALKPDPDKNLLLRVESELKLNFDHWPGGIPLIPDRDQANYSCKASSNGIGPEIESITRFRVHYPPKSIGAKPKEQTVIEKSNPDPFRCSSDSFPLATYTWRSHGTNETWHGETLTFTHPVRRNQAGVYTCTAANRLGQLSTEVILRVLFPPKCRLTKQPTPTDPSISSSAWTLKCEVIEANPDVGLTFKWYHKGQELPEVTADTLQLSEDSMGTYSCEVSNQIGVGERSSITISGPAALVADSDYSFVVYAGAGLIAILTIVMTAIFCCKRYDVLALPGAASPTTEGKAGNGHLMHNRENCNSTDYMVHQDQSNGVTTTSLLTSSVGSSSHLPVSTRLPPPYVKTNGTATINRLQHNNRLSHNNTSVNNNGLVTIKRVRLAPEAMTITEETVDDVIPVQGTDDPRTRVTTTTTTTTERPPKELWLV